MIPVHEHKWSLAKNNEDRVDKLGHLRENPEISPVTGDRVRVEGADVRVRDYNRVESFIKESDLQESPLLKMTLKKVGVIRRKPRMEKMARKAFQAFK